MEFKQELWIVSKSDIKKNVYKSFDVKANFLSFSFSSFCLSSPLLPFSSCSTTSHFCLYPFTISTLFCISPPSSAYPLSLLSLFPSLTYPPSPSTPPPFFTFPPSSVSPPSSASLPLPPLHLPSLPLFYLSSPSAPFHYQLHIRHLFPSHSSSLSPSFSTLAPYKWFKTTTR